MADIISADDVRYPQFCKNSSIQWKVYILPDGKTIEVRYPNNTVKFRSDCATCVTYAQNGNDFWPGHKPSKVGHSAHCTCDWCF